MITMRQGINLWGAIYVKSDFGSEMDYDMLVCNVYIIPSLFAGYPSIIGSEFNYAYPNSAIRTIAPPRFKNKSIIYFQISMV